MSLRHALLLPTKGGIRTLASVLDGFNAAGDLPAYYLANVASRATATGTFAGTTLLEAGGRTALDMTLTSLPWGAAPDGGIIFDGAVSIGTITDNIALGGLTVSTVFLLAQFDSAGEANFGRMLDYNDTLYLQMQFSGSLNAMITKAETDDVDASSTTTTGVDTNLVALFRDYDDGGDRGIDVFKGQSEVVNEFAYSAEVTATGNLLAGGAGNLFVGNNAATSLTTDGTFFVLAFFNRLLTTVEKLDLTELAAA